MPRRRKFPDTSGNALVEFALVLPLVLTGIFAIIDFGRALYTYHFVSNAAREATRWASVRSSSSTLGSADPTTIQSHVASVSGMGLDPAKITTTPDWTILPPKGGANCPGNKPGCIVKIQVNYSYQFMFPFL